MRDVTILITTYNRLQELRVTFHNLQEVMVNVSVILCDDGSTDGTYAYIKNNYPDIYLVRNDENKGLIYSRNRLLNLVKTKYAISLDDDANFLSQNPVDQIVNFFESNGSCGVVAFRIYWGTKEPKCLYSKEGIQRVRNFVGCGHAWRMDTWRSIPDYPDWFVFYGEENFASFHLLRENWKIYYLPQILVHHRVDIRGRKNLKDYSRRARFSLRAGWYLYFLFYPCKVIPYKFFYSLWNQLALKVFKGDPKALIAIVRAFGDILKNFIKLMKMRNPLTLQEYEDYLELQEARIYWKPEEEIVQG